MGRKYIDFKFAKNWKTFLRWHDSYYAQAKCSPMWDIQERKIEECFEASAQGTVDWKLLWKQFRIWRIDVYKRKEKVLWSEQKRQIETLMLAQHEELNKEQFILAFRHRGKPAVDTNMMTYWDALRAKENLEGDSNGHDGNEDMDNITIVNVNKLIQ